MSDLWRSVGARLERLSPEQHDRVFAAVSHLPHVLAFALVEMIARGPDAETRFAHAGAGFRDFTRIAASSPEMWRDVCLANRAPLANELRSYRACLDRLQSAVDSGDGAALFSLFSGADARAGPGIARILTRHSSSGRTSVGSACRATDPSNSATRPSQFGPKVRSTRLSVNASFRSSRLLFH